MIDSVMPLYVLLWVKVIWLLCLAFYFQHIISKKVIKKVFANAIMIFLLARTVIGFIMVYNNIWQSYNFYILLDHIFAMADAIILCFIWIFLRK
jgi:hypothetical protein